MVQLEYETVFELCEVLNGRTHEIRGTAFHYRAMVDSDGVASLGVAVTPEHQDGFDDKSLARKDSSNTAKYRRRCLAGVLRPCLARGPYTHSQSHSQDDSHGADFYHLYLARLSLRTHVVRTNSKCHFGRCKNENWSSYRKRLYDTRADIRDGVVALTPSVLL